MTPKEKAKELVLNYLNEIKSSDDGYSYFDNYNSTNRHLFNQRVKFERLEKSKKCALKQLMKYLNL